MTRTPEGFLICHNVPIGRTGWMEYLGEEVPEGPPGEIVKVKRSPEELFSKATMSSFEGKSVTNNHPTRNLDIDTVATLERGHLTNVRKDGDFLLADLIIKDQGLIAEIDNGKREVSCGYDCLWVPLNEDHTEYEQKEIIGNHVAVVQNGRAGPRVAIMDQKTKNDKEGSKKKMPLLKKETIIGKMLKAFAVDAEPEEMKIALDALGGGEEEKTPPAGGENPPAESEGTKQILEAIGKLGEAVNGLAERVTALEQSDKDVHKQVEGADAEFESLEKEMAQDEESGESQTVEPEDKKEEEKGTGAAADSFDKFIQGMKKTIMAIPDKAARDKAAKEFVASVRDAMPRKGNANDGYSNILKVVAGNKKTAMDQHQHKSKSMDDLNQDYVNAWNSKNAHYKGGNV